MMFLLSCSTTKEIKTVYYVPDLYFPDFPKLPDYEINDKDEVTVDGEFFRQLLIFKTQYKSTKNEYEKIKKIYDGGE